MNDIITVFDWDAFFILLWGLLPEITAIAAIGLIIGIVDFILTHYPPPFIPRRKI